MHMHVYTDWADSDAAATRHARLGVLGGMMCNDLRWYGTTAMLCCDSGATATREGECPVLLFMSLNAMGPTQGALLVAGHEYAATVHASDADDDSLSYWWVVAPEAAESSSCAGDYRCRRVCSRHA